MLPSTFFTCFVLLSLMGRCDAFAPISNAQRSVPRKTTWMPPQRASSTALAIGPELVATASIPSLSSVALACLTPSLLGFYKSEYGVSYAYGGAISSTAWMVLQRVPVTSLAGIHSLALFVYGIRLCMFLLYRELTIARFRVFREKIEYQAQKRGNRIARTPFVAGVAFLYACMAAPLFVTITTETKFWSLHGGWKLIVARILVGMTCAGFALGALGDTTKTVVKAKRGPDHLVVEGVFRFFRHPNYTGEMLGWTASALAAVVLGGVSWLSLASVVGALGIDFVLVQAATGLERKQHEKYGASESYQNWMRTSWAGVTKKRVEPTTSDFVI
jgi:steroid 5-alpha reductase family enzyme